MSTEEPSLEDKSCLGLNKLINSRLVSIKSEQ